MIPVGSAVATRLLLCGARSALAVGLFALGLEGLHLLLLDLDLDGVPLA
jgi:hypothetical protein